MSKARRIPVIYKKLAKVWGYAYPDGYIEMDERAKGKKKLEILIHETAHLLWPGDSEEQIEAKAIVLTNTLWHEGARFVDNDNDQKLQDGKK